jgi:hypothetical protein
MQLLGVIEAVSETAAIERAVVLYSLDDNRRKRLAGTCGGKRPHRPGHATPCCDKWIISIARPAPSRRLVSGAQRRNLIRIEGDA